MLVVQIFVLRDGVLSGSEVAALPADHGVALGGDGVHLEGTVAPAAYLGTLRGALLLTPGQGDVRVNGERIDAPTVISARDDVQVGVFVLKVRVLSGAPVAAAAVETRVERARPAPVLELAATLPGVSDTVPEVAAGDAGIASFNPIDDAFIDPLDDAFDDADADDERALWSLRDHLEGAAPSRARPALLEVVRLRGESVLDHRCLAAGDTLRIGRRAVVRMLSRGRAEIDVADGVTGRLRTPGGVVELTGGLAQFSADDVAELRVGDEQWLVRFTSSVALAWSREDGAEDRFAKRLLAVAATAGTGLLSMLGGLVWLREMNKPPVVQALPDPEVFFVPPSLPRMQPPPPPPTTGSKAPTHDSHPPAKAAGPSVTAAKKSPPASALDVLRNLPAHDDKLAAAVGHIHDPVSPSGTLHLTGISSRGPRGGTVGGSGRGLETSGRVGGAGGLAAAEARGPRGRVTTTPPAIKPHGGTLPMDAIRRVIEAHLGEIQHCYERALQDVPGLHGRLKLRWTILSDGRVGSVMAADPDLPSDAARSCMMGRVKTWKFDAPSGGTVDVTFPFQFAPM